MIMLKEGTFPNQLLQDIYNIYIHTQIAVKINQHISEYA
jgi:hypothetical protein